jgi:hypothetical protein
MSTVRDGLSPIFAEHAGFLASNLTPEITGVVDAVIWAFAGEPTRSGGALGPRIWVVPGRALAMESLSDAVAVRLSVPPEVLGVLPPALAQQSMEFVDANRGALLQYWGGRMATRDLFDCLVNV